MPSPIYYMKTLRTKSRTSRLGRLLVSVLMTLALYGTVTAVAAERAVAPGPSGVLTEGEDEDVTKMPAFNVRADRVEDFGFRVSGATVTGFIPKGAAPFITAVLPNTAADKAGLQPGDRILKSDGRSATSTVFSLSKWRKLMLAKNAEAAAGKKAVTWTLEIQTRGTKSRVGAAPTGGRLVEQSPRIVTLTLPTPPPHWGASKWQPPAGRPPPVVKEIGPLAERSREILAHGITAQFSYDAGAAGGFSGVGQEWRMFVAGGRVHHIFVTQERGRTEIVLAISSAETGTQLFLTSPSGALQQASTWAPKAKPQNTAGRREMELVQARAAFAREMDFWLNEVERGTGRWPFALVADRGVSDAQVAAGVTAAASSHAVPPTVSDTGSLSAPLYSRQPESFLKLPAATPEQRALFADALGKIGADEGRWAYTETSRGLEDKRVTVVRVDPSKPDAERCTLLKIDGKPPTAVQVKQWRDEGRDVSAALGDLPPIAELIDAADIRIVADEIAAVVFEMPLRPGNGNFPAEKFQARCRVNKAWRGFEDFSIKLREAVGVPGVARITDAGLEARFQSFDATLAPQPVWLKAGGGVRVLLVKFSRSFESTRTDFQRVDPFEAAANP